MALNQTNKLVWIVETIYKARKITFEELNRQWMDNVDLSGGEEMLKRTFHKWKWNIFDTFGLMIECEKAAPYRYYIENVEDMRNGGIENWLLSTYSVSNALIESKSIKDRILLDYVPSGREYLEPILEAMKKNRFVHITYNNYWRDNLREHYIMPLCVKLFRQRWYVVGCQWPSGNDTIYCLDRIRGFRLSSHSFEYPEDFNPKEYFDGCFGIIADKTCDIQKVRIKVSPGQANYLRDLPLHESQQEAERKEEYSIFEYRIRPTFDFQQEILWNGEDMEVIEPLWLRDEIAGKIKRMWNKYNNISMNKSIEKELENLFIEWHYRIMKASDNTPHFTRDGLMYNNNSHEHNEATWFSSSKRVLFLLKDQNQKGEEKWDEDIREWLINTPNDTTESHQRIKEANRNLAPRFIRNIAYLLWGLSKADNDNPWWYDEVTKHLDEVKEFFNIQPFAIVECKKQPGGGNLSPKELKRHLRDFGDLIKREIEILSPTMIICASYYIYGFILDGYPQDELMSIEGHKEIRYHKPSGTLIFCSYHPSDRKSPSDIYDGVMYHYRAFLEYQSTNK